MGRAKVKHAAIVAATALANAVRGRGIVARANASREVRLARAPTALDNASKSPCHVVGTDDRSVCVFSMEKMQCHVSPNLCSFCSFAVAFFPLSLMKPFIKRKRVLVIARHCP